ncbi:MAG: hypothetical protein CMH98_01910 [Oceanospirillaceae bacterium]|nr:hypothetical protein [Oceanospirillaceae bacterium]
MLQTGQKLLSYVALLLLMQPAVADVIPDGTTETYTSKDSLGRTVVDIAAAGSDAISYNRYNEFNVDNHGVILNNRTAGARTIINEVTSQSPTNIDGELRVAGVRAHLIIANPNGISVNGGELFNAASVGLVTGSVDFQTRTDGFGGSYRNPLINVAGGHIHIGEGGLSGVMNQLELISRSLTIEGPVSNSDEAPFSDINIKTGMSENEFNSNLSVSASAESWVTSNITDASSDSIAVDITRYSSLQSSRINMMITDAGAGVRIAGDVLATANAFTLSANGKVTVSGDIKAAGAVDIAATEFTSVAAADEQNTIESQYSSLTLDALGNISLESTLMSAAASSEDGSPAFSIHSDNLVTLTSRTENERSVLFSYADAEIEAEEITLNSARIITNSDLSINSTIFNNQVLIDDFVGRGEIVNGSSKGKRLWYTAFLQKERESYREIDFGEPDAGRIASEIVAGSGDISINTSEYSGYGGNVIANDGSIDISADNFINEAAVVGRAWMSSRCNLGGCDERGGSNVELLGGSIQASNELNIIASDSLDNLGGTLQAVNDVTLNASEMASSGIEVYDVLTRNKGLRGLLLKNDALWIAVDQGGAVISNMGMISLGGSVLTIDGGRIESAGDISGDYDIVRKPTTQELIMRERIGIGEDIF